MRLTKSMKKFIEKYHSQLFICIGLLIFATLFIIFYPPIYVIQDEADHFDFAYRLKEGTIYFDPLTSHKILPKNGRFVDMYPPGMALLLLPFTFLHWRALFLLNFLLHITGFFFFIKSLKLLKIDVRFSLLYLFFPGFVLYSRTLMPDPAIASLVSVALYFYLKGRRVDICLSGMIFGFIVLVKNVLFIIPLCFLFSRVIREYVLKRRSGSIERKSLSFLICLLPFTFLASAYNFFAFGSAVNAPVATLGFFSVKFFPSHFIFYVTFLNLFYPLMFFSPFVYSGKQKLEFLLSPLVFLMVLSNWYFIQPAEGTLQRFIVGGRYFLPLIPVYLLTYSDVMHRFIAKIRQVAKLLFFIFILVVLVCSSYLISAKHQIYLKQQDSYRNLIYNNTPEGSFIACNFEVVELLQREWGDRKWAFFGTSTSSAYSNLPDEFYIIVLLRKDKPRKFMKAERRKEELVRKYNATLVKEIKEPYKLQIYRAKR